MSLILPLSFNQSLLFTFLFLPKSAVNFFHFEEENFIIIQELAIMIMLESRFELWSFKISEYFSFVIFLTI
jgi:hypothetical protein